MSDPVVRIAGTQRTGEDVPPVAVMMGAKDASNKTQHLKVNASNELLVASSGSGSTTQPVGGATGGLTKFKLTAAATENATNVKASPGTLYNISVFGISATPAWVTFYDTAGVPTPGTGVVWEALIPGNANGAGSVTDIAVGLAFTTGIGICVTTGIGGTGAVVANVFVVNLGYK